MDTVKTFSDTNIDVKEMSNIHKLYKTALKDGFDLKTNGGYESIHKQIKDLEEKDNYGIKVKYNEDKEYLKIVEEKKNSYNIYAFDETGEKMVDGKKVRKNIFEKIATAISDWWHESDND